MLLFQKKTFRATVRVVTTGTLCIWIGWMLRYGIELKNHMASIAKLRLLLLKQMFCLSLVRIVAENALARNHRAVNIELCNAKLFVAIET